MPKEVAMELQKRRELLRSVIEASDVASAPGSAERYLRLQVAGVDLEAWITEDQGLRIRVEAAEGWDTAVERQLYEALDRQRSLIATLVLWEWPDVCNACAASARSARGSEAARALKTAS